MTSKQSKSAEESSSGSLIDHSVSLLVCCYCKATFPGRYKLNIHQRTCTPVFPDWFVPEEAFGCVKCWRIIGGEEARNHTCSGEYSCFFCKKKFPSMDETFRHHTHEHDQPPEFGPAFNVGRQQRNQRARALRNERIEEAACIVPGCDLVLRSHLALDCHLDDVHLAWRREKMARQFKQRREQREAALKAFEKEKRDKARKAENEQKKMRAKQMAEVRQNRALMDKAKEMDMLRKQLAEKEKEALQLKKEEQRKKTNEARRARYAEKKKILAAAKVAAATRSSADSQSSDLAVKPKGRGVATIGAKAATVSRAGSGNRPAAASKSTPITSKRSLKNKKEDESQHVEEEKPAIPADPPNKYYGVYAKYKDPEYDFDSPYYRINYIERIKRTPIESTAGKIRYDKLLGWANAEIKKQVDTLTKSDHYKRRFPDFENFDVHLTTIIYKKIGDPAFNQKWTRAPEDGLKEMVEEEIRGTVGEAMAVHMEDIRDAWDKMCIRMIPTYPNRMEFAIHDIGFAFSPDVRTMVYFQRFVEDSKAAAFSIVGREWTEEERRGKQKNFMKFSSPHFELFIDFQLIQEGHTRNETAHFNKVLEKMGEVNLSTEDDINPGCMDDYVFFTVMRAFSSIYPYFETDAAENMAAKILASMKEQLKEK